MAFPTCTVTNISALIPCLKCVDKEVLLAYSVQLMAQLASKSTDPATVRNNAACLTCYSDEDLLRMQTALLAELAVAKGKRSSWTAQALQDETECLQCLPPHDLLAAFTLLLCNYLATL